MGIKIKDLPIVTEVKDSDYILIDDAESTNKININNLLTIDNINNLQPSLDNKQQKIAVNQPYTQGTLTSITIDGVNYRVSSAAVVSDYLNLNNTPKINGVDLGKKLDDEGNPVSQSSSDLLLQDKLVSGETIKTINNESLLGSGNIDIKDGSSDWNLLTNRPFESIDNNSFSVEYGVLKVITTNEVAPDNTKPITSAGVSAVVGNIGMKYDLLWQNAKPTSQFASQNIDINNADNYSFFLICFKGSSTWEDQINGSLLIPNINTYFTLTFVDTSRVVHHRGGTLYSTYVSFESGKQNGNTNNADAIPMYIYGIK